MVDDYVDAMVPEVFAQADVNDNRTLSKDEFVQWARRNPSALQWLDNLAKFILSVLSSELRVEDFDAASDFQIL